MENEKQQQQDVIRKLTQQVREQEKTIESLSRDPKSSQTTAMDEDIQSQDTETKQKVDSSQQPSGTSPMDIDQKSVTLEQKPTTYNDPKFQQFLELRKQLRRSVFKGEEVSRYAGPYSR